MRARALSIECAATRSPLTPHGPDTMQRSLLLLLAGLSVTTLVQGQGAPVGPLPRDVTPTHYRLSLTIDPRKEDFTGETTIDVTVHHATKLIWVHGMGLK